MCAQLTRGLSFSSTETITNTKLHQLVDNATISNIVDADISASAAIQFSKILSSAIDGSQIVNLPNLLSGAGKIPFANLPLPLGASYVSLVSIPWVSVQQASSLPSTSGQFPWWSIVGSLASGATPMYNGSSLLIGKPIVSTSNIQIFTSSDTFVAPSGITKVYLSMVGGGGGGGGRTSGNAGGGSSGAFVLNYPYTVVPGNSYIITINAGGTGGTGNNAGSTGGTTVFDSLTITGGVGGTTGNSGGAAVTAPGGFDASQNTTGSFMQKGGNGGAQGGGGGGFTGAGGASPFGVGGAGVNGTAGNSASANTGAGGSGSGSTPGAGGNGGSGICIVMY